MNKPVLDTRRSGLRWLRAALLFFGSVTAGLVAWTVAKALAHPEVRTKRPGWLEETAGFDVSFWIPLVLTLAIGGSLVMLVFMRAYRRMRAGEDLYQERFGRGLRRHGERHLEEPPSKGSNQRT